MVFMGIISENNKFIIYLKEQLRDHKLRSLQDEKTLFFLNMEGLI